MVILVSMTLFFQLGRVPCDVLKFYEEYIPLVAKCPSCTVSVVVVVLPLFCRLSIEVLTSFLAMI